MVSKELESANIAVDPVIFTIHEGRLKVLLHTREKEPFKGLKELPGGLLRTDETAQVTLKRKLKELVGHDNLYLEQFETFTDPARDPRERTISIGFVSLVHEAKIKDIVQWHDAQTLRNLAFDHVDIVASAREYLKKNVTPLIVKQFLPRLFPLNTLQTIYELLQETKYDNRNFRKKMISSDIVEETDQLEENVSHRPAKLFKFK